MTAQAWFAPVPTAWTVPSVAGTVPMESEPYQQATVSSVLMAQAWLSLPL